MLLFVWCLCWKLRVLGSGGCVLHTRACSSVRRVQVLFCRKEGSWAGFVGGRGAEKRAAEVKEPNAQHHPFTATKSHIFRIPSYRSEKRVETSVRPITRVHWRRAGRRQTPTHRPEERRTKKMKCALVLALVLFGLVALGSANPGFKVTLTQNGTAPPPTLHHHRRFLVIFLFLFFLVAEAGWCVHRVELRARGGGTVPRAEVRHGPRARPGRRRPRAGHRQDQLAAPEHRHFGPQPPAVVHLHPPRPRRLCQHVLRLPKIIVIVIFIIII